MIAIYFTAYSLYNIDLFSSIKTEFTMHFPFVCLICAVMSKSDKLEALLLGDPAEEHDFYTKWYGCKRPYCILTIATLT